MLDQGELKRFSRQILIPEFGIGGQEKLKKSSVLVIGCGGLGSSVLLYLAAAGIGRIGIVENDSVETSNLQRQILYSEDSVGKLKIEETEKRLKSINEKLVIEKFSTRITSINALEIIRDFDVVIDGSDNFPTRYLVNDACVLRGKPLVYGAVYRFEGQVSVFNFEGGVNYRDLFPSPPLEEMAPNCAVAGVLGVMTGIIGSLQSLEAIKILTGIGSVLSGKLLIVESLSMSFRKMTIFKNPDVEPIQSLIDYEKFCGILEDSAETITVEAFKSSDISQLIDVREIHEFELENLGGELMPLSDLDLYVSKIKRDGLVVLYCQSGARSAKAVKVLREDHDFSNIVSLEGGINAFYS